MKTYHVTVTIKDCTEVCADSVEEAEQIATDVFTESGHELDPTWEFTTQLVSEEEL